MRRLAIWTLDALGLWFLDLARRLGRPRTLNLELEEVVMLDDLIELEPPGDAPLLRFFEAAGNRAGRTAAKQFDWLDDELVQVAP